MNENKDLYERYHQSRKSLKRPINNNDLTYFHITRLIDRYSKRAKRALDIGCGVGTLSLYLASKNIPTLGIDISQKGIETATNNAQKLTLSNLVHFKQNDFPVEKLRGKFDFILCCEVLEHIKNEELAVSTLGKLTKKDGIAIISVPSMNAPLYRMGLLKKFDKEVGHLRRYSAEKIKNLFTLNKFETIEIQKREGFARNFLFTNDQLGFIIKAINKTSPGLFTVLDELTVPMFGESDILAVFKKTKS